ncbi:MAG: HAD family hydrolase [Candidatus Heimdallarchaeota archaeon]
MKKLIEIKGVLFDFDETLLDSYIGAKKAWSEVAKLIQEFLCEKGISHELDHLRTEIEQIANAMNRKRQYNRDEWWKLLISRKTRSLPPKEFFTHVTEKYFESLIKGSALYPDTLSTLRYLKGQGYRLGLLTDTDHVKAMKWRRIKLSGLGKWFKAIVVSGEEGIKAKPDPDSFRLLARRLNLRPEDCVFIGDKTYLDIKGAKAARMTTILIKRREWDCPVDPDFIVETLQELQELL